MEIFISQTRTNTTTNIENEVRARKTLVPKAELKSVCTKLKVEPWLSVRKQHVFYCEVLKLKFKVLVVLLLCDLEVKYLLL